MSDATDGPTPGRSDDELDQLVRDALGEVSEERFGTMIAAAVSTEQHDRVEPVDRADTTRAGPVVELRSSRTRPGGTRWNLRNGLLAAAASVAVIAGAVFILSPKDQGDDVAGPPNTGSPTTAVAGPTGPTTGDGPCELSEEAEPTIDPASGAPTIPRRGFRCSIRMSDGDRNPDVVLFDDGRLVAGLVVPEESPNADRSGWSCIEFGEPRPVEDAGALPAGPDSRVDGGVILDQAATGEGTQAAGLEYGSATCDGSGLTVTPTGPGRFELPYRVRYCFTLDDTRTTANADLPDSALQTGGGVGCQRGAPGTEPDGLVTVQVAPAT